MVRPRGIEPPHPAPEAGALSTELRAHAALLIIAEYQKQVKGLLVKIAFITFEINYIGKVVVYLLKIVVLTILSIIY